MFSTHTLVSYPIASRYGVARNKAVTLTVGGTMITDILALLILAAVAGMTRDEVSSAFWIQLGLSSLIFVAIVFFIFPLITRWFFKNYEDSVSQYIFVLGMVFLASFLAEAAGLEAIIGAFFAGLVLNKFVPHSSPLMNRIDFVGNALFIPFFLIGVGMLVDVTILVKGWGALRVAGVIITVAIVTKYVAAWLTRKAFKLSFDEGRMIFGLSSSHAAATLAIILVGYNIVIGETAVGEPIRLLNEDVLNGTILLILVSCAVSSFVVEKASRNLALSEESERSPDADSNEKILITLAYPETTRELVDFGLFLKPKKNNIPVYALHVTDEENSLSRKPAEGKKILEQAVKHAAATENTIIPLSRFDMNISNGIVYTIKEQNITDVLIGLHKEAETEKFLGPKVEAILRRTLETIYIYKPSQPLNTLKRMIVVVPARAEAEPGFVHWFNKLHSIAKEAGMSIGFYGVPETLKDLMELHHRMSNAAKASFNNFSNWEDFLIFSRELKSNDLFVIVSSRKGHVSYNNQLQKLPYYLRNYFMNNSFIILYPKQLDTSINMGDVQQADSTLIDTFSGKMNVVGKALGYLKSILRK